MPRLSNNDRKQALGMLRAGISTREVARLFNCHQSTVVRLRQRFQTMNNVSDRSRPGQPRVTTDQQDHHIRLQHLRNRFKTAASTARETPGRHNPRISSATVRRRLRENGLRARRPFRGPLLTPRHRQQRLAWARTHLQWTRQRWQEVLFSDESCFCISNADGRIRVWRRQNERLAACCIYEVDRWGGTIVMNWAAVSFRYKSPLHFCDRSHTEQRFRDEILAPYVVPMFQAHQDLRIFQQDNACPHTARVSMKFLQAQNVNCMHWPSLSPDMAPIEHVWDALGRRVDNRPVKPTTGATLRQALLEEWNNMPQRIIQNNILSMGRRCVACITTRGGHTKY